MPAWYYPHNLFRFIQLLKATYGLRKFVVPVHQIQQNFPLLSQEDGKGVLDLPMTPPHRNEQFPKMCTTEMVNITLMLLFYEFNKGEVINGVLRSWNPFYDKSKLCPFLTPDRKSVV